jgi:hypothetical protein
VRNKKEIVFTNILGYDFYPPKPAKNAIPEWYKNTSPYIDSSKIIDKEGGTTSTIKKCMPVFDAITSGYVLYTQVDVQVTQKKENGELFKEFKWPSQNPIDFHPISQASLHPKRNEYSYFKWINPYLVTTPAGYSTLFLPPLHNPNSIFTILEGIVDTDIFKSPVSLPFTFNNQDWEGIIPAGTPMAQVIPIKRDIWQHSFGSKKEIKEMEIITAKLRSVFFNKYKNLFWQKKEYK